MMRYQENNMPNVVLAMRAAAALASTLIVLLSPAAASAPIGNWSVDRARSSFDDSPTVELELRASKRISGWPNKVETPVLVLRCQEHKTEVFIQTGMAPDVERGLFGRATVRLRLDDDPALQRIASKSTDGKALFLPQPVSLIRSLAEHKRMVFGFTPFHSSPVETEFNLDGLSEAVKSLYQACPAH
jgi:hypothetical protein